MSERTQYMKKQRRILLVLTFFVTSAQSGALGRALFRRDLWISLLWIVAISFNLYQGIQGYRRISEKLKEEKLKEVERALDGEEDYQGSWN